MPQSLAVGEPCDSDLAIQNTASSRYSDWLTGGHMGQERPMRNLQGFKLKPLGRRCSWPSGIPKKVVCRLDLLGPSFHLIEEPTKNAASTEETKARIRDRK